jgi:hypothetical protein
MFILVHIKRLRRGYISIRQLFEPLSKYRGINAIPSDALFKTPQQRLASFIHWPLSTRYWPGQLAEAGFVYTGREWDVRCYLSMHDLVSSSAAWPDIDGSKNCLPYDLNKLIN